MVPVEGVPLTNTLTPGMGAPDTSVTTPDTVMVWALTRAVKAKTARHIKHNDLNSLHALSGAEPVIRRAKPVRHSFGKKGLFFFMVIGVFGFGK